jgi:hypothetical protein
MELVVTKIRNTLGRADLRRRSREVKICFRHSKSEMHLRPCSRESKQEVSQCIWDHRVGRDQNVQHRSLSFYSKESDQGRPGVPDNSPVVEKEIIIRKEEV